MIHLKAIMNKSNIKQIIIFFLLFVSIIIFICLFKNTSDIYLKEKEKEDYRTIYITIKPFVNKEEILNDDMIEKYLNEENEYIIVLKSSNNVDNFKLKYNNMINRFASQSFNDSSYKISKTIISIILSISIIIMTILIFVFSINYIYNIEKDIALYKLIGYSNNKIIKLFIIYMLLLYFVIYIISIIISFIITKYIITIAFISVLEILILYLFVIIIVLISFIRIIKRIKKISPIELINSY